MSATNQSPSWPELAAILLARLGLLWALVLVALLLPRGDAAFHACLGIALIASVPCSLWLRGKMLPREFAPLQFMVDLVLVTGLIYFTGGVHSDFTLLYPLIILSAGILAAPITAMQITLLGILTYLLMAVLLDQNMLAQYLPEGKTVEHAASYPSILLRTFAFACFGVAGIFVSKRCNFIPRTKGAAKPAPRFLLENVPSPTMLLDRNGRILGVNEPVCQLLNTPAEKLSALTFENLVVEGKTKIPDTYGTAAYLARTDLPALPVAYRSADVQIPATPLPGRHEPVDEVTVTLLALRDISLPLELERQLSKVDRITAATRIAGEMAHEIRTPLTAISASVQLLKHYEEHATAAEWLPNAPRRKDRIELFEHIASASEQMDSVIKNFIDFAEFSPADLLSIIRLDSSDENQGYIGHLNMIGRGLDNGQDFDSGRRSDNSKFAQ